MAILLANNEEVVMGRDGRFDRFRNAAIEILNKGDYEFYPEYKNLLKAFEKSKTLYQLKCELHSNKIHYCPAILEDIDDSFLQYNSDYCIEDEKCLTKDCWTKALDHYLKTNKK